jgi:hypothetical protein
MTWKIAMVALLLTVACRESPTPPVAENVREPWRAFHGVRQA